MNKPLILVVEDNTVLQKVMQLISRKCNIDADIVSNGNEALTALSTNKPYQVVFMDWRMPDMDGLECTRQIRVAEQSTGAHIPIVAMTANADDEDRQACMSVGMDDYLCKPFTTEEFNRVLRRWLAPESMAM